MTTTKSTPLPAHATTNSLPGTLRTRGNVALLSRPWRVGVISSSDQDNTAKNRPSLIAERMRTIAQHNDTARGTLIATAHQTDIIRAALTGDIPVILIENTGLDYRHPDVPTLPLMRDLILDAGGLIVSLQDDDTADTSRTTIIDSYRLLAALSTDLVIATGSTLSNPFLAAVTSLPESSTLWAIPRTAGDSETNLPRRLIDSGEAREWTYDDPTFRPV